MKQISIGKYFLLHPLVRHVTALLPEWLKSVSRILAESLVSWIDHRAASKGAALAFYTLISLTPILILSIAVAGYFFGEQAAQGQVISQIRYLVGPNGAIAIQSLLAAANDHVRGLWATLIASILLLVGATSVFAELKGSLDELWGVKKSELSPVGVLLKTRLLAFGLVLVLTFLLLISLVISTALTVFSHYIGATWNGSYILFFVLSELISFGVIACLFAVIYKMLPDAPLSWRDVWIGAAFTAGLFTLGKYVIGVYLGNNAIASGFGAAGSVTALLLWVYYSAQIFFLGAEFTRQYALRYGSLQQQKGRQLALDMILANPMAKVSPSA